MEWVSKSISKRWRKKWLNGIQLSQSHIKIKEEESRLRDMQNRIRWFFSLTKKIKLTHTQCHTKVIETSEKCSKHHNYLSREKTKWTTMHRSLMSSIFYFAHHWIYNIQWSVMYGRFIKNISKSLCNLFISFQYLLCVVAFKIEMGF